MAKSPRVEAKYVPLQRLLGELMTVPRHVWNFADAQRALPFTRRKDLRDLCPKAKPNALDLMRRCLT